MIKATENYQNLSIGFRDVLADINELIANPAMAINEENYETIFYPSSDYKVTIQ